MYQALYRKWRPKTFDDVCGQNHVTDILKAQIISSEIPHAYLFYGSRGTGKTSCAKILAKAVNCLHPVNGNPCGQCSMCKMIDSGLSTDVLEIDAASNNGVDNVRDIRNDAAYAPSEAKFRVLIIDEVHMLTVPAFNALLKTLEEPPQHMIFILATTEKQKIPNTILSRCQRFDFHRIDHETIARRLRMISDEEHILISDDALGFIARIAEGGMRDALGFLEVCKGASEHILEQKDVAGLIGVSDEELVFRCAGAVCDKDYNSIYEITDTVYKKGDITVFTADLLRFWRNMMMIVTTPHAKRYLSYDSEHFQKIQSLAKEFNFDLLFYQIGVLETLYINLKTARESGQIPLEIALLKLCDRRMNPSPEALLLRISELEEKVLLLSSSQPEHAKPDMLKPEKKAPVEVPHSDSTAKAPDVISSPAAFESPKEQLLKMNEWPDIVNHISQKDKALAAFLKSYQAYFAKDYSKVYIFAGDAFSVRLIDEEKKKKLSAAIGICTDKTVAPERIYIKDEKQKTSQFELIDEIISQIT